MLRLVLRVAVCLNGALGFAAPPNVILVITDDQGYGDLACHGNPVLKTPHLDRLHQESVRLTDFHVDPTCSPTRAALMTGRYAQRVGVWLTFLGRHRIRADEPTMADVFSAGGYRTAIFGKWHLGDNFPFRPQDRGFDETLIHGGGVVSEAPDYWDNDYYDDVYFRNGKPDAVRGYCTDVWFDEAMRFISRHRSRPFFIYLAANAPHGPLHVPDAFVKPYRDAGIPERRARFYGMIANIDENMGRLRRHLQQEDLDENTLMIFLLEMTS
ncbi:MAG: sulfatase-like hydrolase/transferase [Verrucomicrobiota bacterium]